MFYYTNFNFSTEDAPNFTVEIMVWPVSARQERKSLYESSDLGIYGLLIEWGMPRHRRAFYGVSMVGTDVIGLTPYCKRSTRSLSQLLLLFEWTLYILEAHVISLVFSNHGRRKKLTRQTVALVRSQRSLFAVD